MSGWNTITNETYDGSDQCIPEWCSENKRGLEFPYHYATQVKKKDGFYGFNVYWIDWGYERPTASPRFYFKTKAEAEAKRQNYITWEILMDEVKHNSPYTVD